MTKKILVSGIKPSSDDITIANFLGAVKQWLKLQESYKMFLFIADEHAITVPQEPKKLSENTLRFAVLLFACGLDPKKTTLFIQSYVPAHFELAWILNTLTPLGELERMVQFKEKSREVGVLAGLLNYPVLQAADILLYQPYGVPVGEDQLQHLELTRALARRFNNRFGKTFAIPRALISKGAERIMALDDPAKKMSKSAENPDNYIALLDPPEEIRRKIKIAVTDSGKEIRYDPATKPAISNLMTIYSAFSGLTRQQIEKKYSGKGYSEFKSDLAELLIKKLAPIQERCQKLIKNKTKVLDILQKGASEARKISEKTLKEVKRKVGFLVLL